MKPSKPGLFIARRKAGTTAQSGSGHGMPETGSRTIAIHREKCTGCRACEQACSVGRGGRTRSEPAAIRVIIEPEKHEAARPVLCCSCEEADCVRVCPGDALTRYEESGFITIDESRCSGCKSCVLSCPFEIIHLGGHKGLARPCDLCGGAPKCVEACTTGALEIVELP